MDVSSALFTCLSSLVLDSDIKFEVIGTRLANLKEVIAMATLFEEKSDTMKWSSRWESSVASPSSASSKGDKQLGKEVGEGSSSVPIKWLTPAYIQENRRHTLCFNCDETWSVSHKCKVKQAFIMEGVYIGDELEDEDINTEIDQGWSECG